ncbi:MAG TPA: hypothetical protein VN660_13595 [Steroidobacteraceae bacterium]|nr:hypothetical protein [Steroidobacteraceae bacterium]
MKPPPYFWSEHFGLWIARRHVAGYPMWLKPGAPVFAAAQSREDEGCS